MRILCLLIWLMVAVTVGAYHYGPGQQKLLLDEVATILAQADSHAANEQWAEAERKYEQVLSLLPQDRVHERRRVRLERAKAQMFVKKLPVAHQELTHLVDELKADEKADQRLFDEARTALANSQYYMTWLMRLEGQPRERWEPEIESARQTFRLLAEQSDQKSNKTSAIRYQEDLESAIRLARMDLSELQGLPLPSQ